VKSVDTEAFISDLLFLSTLKPVIIVIIKKSSDYSDTITQKNVAGALYSQYRNVTFA